MSRPARLRLLAIAAAVASAVTAQAAGTPPAAPKPEAKAPAAESKPAKAAGAPAAAQRKASAAEPTAVGANLLVNPGFEHGRDPWNNMPGANWGNFDIATSPVRSGQGSARLLVQAAADSTNSAKVFGVVQEIRRDTMPGDFPDTLSGWYRVNTWDKPKTGMDLYLQAVVIIWGDPRSGKILAQGAAEKPVMNYQIRFYLAGLEKPAFVLSNAKLEFVTRAEPVVGEWVHFEIPVKEKFQQDWGVVPAGYEFIRVLFEARWDNKKTGETALADVNYDDLFLGYGKPPDSPAKH